MTTLQSVDRSRMTVDDILADLQAKIGDYTPVFELRLQAELAFEINQLKQARNAVILGHNYMEPALFHSVPDFVGDSLDLSRKAAQTDKRFKAAKVCRAWGSGSSASRSRSPVGWKPACR